MIRALLIAATLGLTAPAFAQEPDFGGGVAAPQGEIWELDQLRIARDVPEATLKALEPAHSLDAAVKILDGLHIAHTRAHVRLPVDRLPPELKGELLKLPDGEPFVIPETDFWSISVIVGRTLPPGTVGFHPIPTVHPLAAISRKA